MNYFLLFFFLLTNLVCAQFAPPAGQPGTTAIHKDSAVFIAWASACELHLGPQDLSNDTSAMASVGTSSSAIGIAGTNGIVSLGDGGTAILTFNSPIADGPGFDFAVFENSFSDDFLEFGFVEVSSDGTNFFRFPAISNIQDTLQTGPFDLSNASSVNNLAGKYRANYGTPFDLQELAGISGLDIMNITHVKIIDVVGSIDPAYATYDSNGNKINDPFPTPFPSSGFDLDAVGVIHAATVGLKQNSISEAKLFPNPCTNVLNIQSIEQLNIIITTIDGKIVEEKTSNTGISKLDLSNLAEGVYYIKLSSSSGTTVKKLIRQ